MPLAFRRDEKGRVYFISFTPMLDMSSNTIGAMTIFRDMSGLLQARDAEAASRAKSAFLANMSREMRAPLDAIISLCEAEMSKDLSPGIRDSVKKIYASSVTLLGIINDTPDISKIEPDKFEIAPVTSGPANLTGGARTSPLIDGLDVEEGMARFGGDKIYARVIRSYVTHTPEQLDSIRSVNAETLRDYAITAHGIKGASRGICAFKVGDAAEIMEKLAKEGNLAEVVSRNGEFLAEAEALIDSLRSLIGQETAGREAKPSPEAPLLTRMRERAVHYDHSGMEEVMEELERFEYESGGELIEWLRERVESLEYDEIAERLESFFDSD
jgi:signal transduction histidine kinase